MRKAATGLLSLGLGLLGLAALDDITTGSEPGYGLEWTVVALAAGWLAGLAWWGRRRPS